MGERQNSGMEIGEEYLAHVADDGRVESLRVHLEEVSRMAGEFADAFGCRQAAEQMGLAHDIGKYSRAFQRRSRGSSERVDHSTAGAFELLQRGSWLGAYCVAGHHGGLPDGVTLASRIAKAEEGGIPDYSAFESEISLPETATLLPDSLDFSHCKTWEDFSFSQAFVVRMLYSCLVDPDFLCTEAFMQGREREGLGYDSIDELAEKLEAHLDRLQADAWPSLLRDARRQVSSECLAFAKEDPGVYTLTAPTASGKTLASPRFALNHARFHGMRRVIYAIPYTSIIEQNAKVFRDVFGEENVLEHHSNFEFPDGGDGIGERLRLASENWDAPIVVTTNVQLFESLFAAKPSRCRKLHNIAGSVIVLDEAQMIPVHCVDPCVHALVELVKNYGCTVVLCTATQPALNERFEALGVQVREIMSDPRELAERLERVTYEDAGQLSNDDLAQRLAAQPQVLCVLNTRKHVKGVYALLQGMEAEGIYHLSTYMHALHRSQVIAEIRERLAAGLPCRVVSTSLIEAGVDIDFPVVYRSFAGVDSIIQAAGRCNREGRLGHAGGRVVVFELEGEVSKLEEEEKEKGFKFDDMGMRQSLTRETLRSVGDDFSRIGTFDAVAYYSKILMRAEGDRLDKAGVLKALDIRSTCAHERAPSIPFKSVADSFHLIEKGAIPVLIPDDAVRRELAALRAGVATRADMRHLSRYSVNVYKETLEELKEHGAVEEVGDQLYALIDERLYDENTGLDMGKLNELLAL